MLVQNLNIFIRNYKCYLVLVLTYISSRQYFACLVAQASLPVLSI